MPKRTGFHVLVGTDGSPQARAAVAATVAFPWPRGARVHGVVARGGWGGAEWPAAVWTTLERRLDRVRLDARRTLARRWPDADVLIAAGSPVQAILTAARRVGARAIVLGSRGHGALDRFLLGSVSRGVVRRAACAVLIVKGRPRKVRRLVIGLDGSAHSRRVVEFVAGLHRPAGGRITLVSIVEPVRVPAMALVPASVRAAVRGQAAELTEAALRTTRREVERAARRLEAAGWAARPLVRLGVPLPELLRSVRVAGADVLGLGARGVGGLARLLLGSVAEGALSRSPVSVLIVK